MAHPSWPRLAFNILLAAGLIGAGFDLSTMIDWGGRAEGCGQHDFRSYYFAAKAIALGISPYDTDAINRQFGFEAFFVYPWFMTAPFRLLTGFTLDEARLIFTALKLAATIPLAMLGYALWARPGKALPWIVFLAIGLNGTWLRDMCLGNATVFEVLLLWAGLALLLRGRIGWFCLCVALASADKLVYAGFLALAPLLYPQQKEAWLAAMATVAGIAGLLALGLLLEPQLMGEWYRNIRPIPGHRFSWFNLGKFIFEIQGVAGAQPPYWRRGEAYLFAITTVLAWGGCAWAYWRAWRAGQPLSRGRVVSLFVLAFAASVPFGFSYSWIYALGAVFLTIKAGLARSGPRPLASLALAGLALTPQSAWALAGFALPYNYVHLLTASAACLLLIVLTLSDRRADYLRTNTQ